MMLQIGDDGVVSTVNEDDLIYVDKNELDELVDRYNRLKEENGQLKQLIKETLEITPMEHSLAIKLKNSIREMYE